MIIERSQESRKKAQMRLSQAQDAWIDAIERFGPRSDNPQVESARKELEEARAEYIVDIKRGS